MRRLMAVVASAGLGILLLHASDLPLLAQKAPTIAQVRADAEAKAYNADYDPAAVQDAMGAAGATPAEIDAEISKLGGIIDKAKAKKKDAGKDQNASGTADWNFGQVYRGSTYNLNFPLTNSCLCLIRFGGRFSYAA